MNKPTTVKLAGYSALAAGVIAGNESKAQVIYSDIIPDIELTAYYDEFYDLDINDDLIPDFRFSANYFIGCMYCDSGSAVSIEPLGSNRVVYIVDSSFSNCYDNLIYKNISPVLEFGEVIDAGLNFYNDELILASRHFYDHEFCESIMGFGEWSGVYDRFVGLEFHDGINIYYGWVRLSMGEWFNLSIQDFGLQTIPLTPIMAGEITYCDPPLPIGADATSGTTAKVKWDPADSVDHYELQYRSIGAVSWTTKTVAGLKTFRKLAGLDCNTNYEWRIRSFCTDGEISVYSTIYDFTTAVCKLENEYSIDEENISIWSYANQIHILIDEDIVEPAQFILFDELGRNVFSNQITESENVFELNLPNGIYIATIYSGDKMYSKKIVMQN